MNILRFPLQLSDRDIDAQPVLLADDRWLAVRAESQVQLFDLHFPNTRPVRILDAHVHTLRDSCLVVGDSSGELHRWEHRQQGWHETGRFSPPSIGRTRLPWPSALSLSQTGLYVLVEWETEDSEPVDPWAITRYLLDARTGEVKRAFCYGQGDFGLFPFGREVLLTQGERVRSVQVVDCASGETLHELGLDHDGYYFRSALEADGTRLLLYLADASDVWEVRIYDTTPLTMQSHPKAHLPLRLVYRHPQVTQSESPIPLLPVDTSDGTIDCVSLVDPGSSPHNYPEDETWFRDDLSPTDHAIYEVLSSFPRSKKGILLRRVSWATGKVVGWSCHGLEYWVTPNLHLLSNHQVLLVGAKRIQLFDGLTGELRDVAEIEVAPTPFFDSAVSSDGGRIVVWWEVDEHRE